MSNPANVPADQLQKIRQIVMQAPGEQNHDYTYLELIGYPKLAIAFRHISGPDVNLCTRIRGGDGKFTRHATASKKGTLLALPSFAYLVIVSKPGHEISAANPLEFEYIYTLVGETFNP